MIDAKDGQAERLTEEEIIANILLVLVAGYETTSSILTYATYCLAVHPEVQERLRAEVDEAVRADGNEIKYETVMNLKFLDAVVKETLRRYPPVLRADRNVTMDYKVSSLGLEVRPGDKIQILIYAIHHQAEFYPDPFKYDPGRFLPENQDTLVPCTFLPFLTGPRNCIGARFALLVAKTALASVILKYNLTRCPQTAVPLDLSNSKYLMNVKEVVINYSKRN